VRRFGHDGVAVAAAMSFITRGYGRRAVGVHCRKELKARQASGSRSGARGTSRSRGRWTRESLRARSRAPQGAHPRSAARVPGPSRERRQDGPVALTRRSDRDVRPRQPGGGDPERVRRGERPTVDSWIRGRRPCSGDISDARISLPGAMVKSRDVVEQRVDLGRSGAAAPAPPPRRRRPGAGDAHARTRPPPRVGPALPDRSRCPWTLHEHPAPWVAHNGTTGSPSGGVGRALGRSVPAP
jgi:hypothetical protein